LPEEENRLLGLGCFLDRILMVLKATSVARVLLVRGSQPLLGFGRRIAIYWGVQLRGEGRSFLLYDEAYTTFLDSILLGLLVYRVFFVLWDGMCDSHIHDGFRMVPTRIYECSGVRP